MALIAAAVVASVLFGLMFEAGTAQASTGGSQITLDCETTGGQVACAIVTDAELEPDQGVQFDINVGGTTQTVTATKENTPSFQCTMCGDAEGVCYRFSFTPDATTQPGGPVEVSNVQPVGLSTAPQSAPVSQQGQAVAAVQQGGQQGEAEGQAEEDSQHPLQAVNLDEESESQTDGGVSTDNTEITAPTGANIVRIQTEGTTITFDQGNNGDASDDDQQPIDYDGTKPPTNVEEAKEQREARQDVTEAVTNIPEDQTVVVTAANGGQSSEQQENAFILEQQAYDRGEPYMVCFDPMSYTRNGEVITVPADCVMVTP